MLYLFSFSIVRALITIRLSDDFKVRTHTCKQLGQKHQTINSVWPT